MVSTPTDGRRHRPPARGRAATERHGSAARHDASCRGKPCPPGHWPTTGMGLAFMELGLVARARLACAVRPMADGGASLRRVDVEWFKQVSPIGWPGQDEIAVSGIGTIAAARVTPRDGSSAPFVAISMYGRWMGTHPSVRSSWRFGVADGSVHRIISDLSTSSATRTRERIAYWPPATSISRMVMATAGALRIGKLATGPCLTGWRPSGWSSWGRRHRMAGRRRYGRRTNRQTPAMWSHSTFQGRTQRRQATISLTTSSPPAASTRASQCGP